VRAQLDFYFEILTFYFLHKLYPPHTLVLFPALSLKEDASVTGELKSALKVRDLINNLLLL